MNAVEELRERSGLTQQQLAMKLGVPLEVIQRWERDELLPKPTARLLITGCLTATLMPPVGLVLGLVLVTRHRAWRHGVPIIVLSLFFGLIELSVILILLGVEGLDINLCGGSCGGQMP